MTRTHPRIRIPMTLLPAAPALILGTVTSDCRRGPVPRTQGLRR